MSLRDQLLSKGLATKKQARKNNRDARRDRKQRQGRRDKSSVERAEQAAQAKHSKEEAKEQKASQRRAREEETSAKEQGERVRQMIEANKITAPGRTSFYHRRLNSGSIRRMELSPKICWMLRCGEAGVAGYKVGDREVYQVVPKKAALRIRTLSEATLVFLVEDTNGISEPDEAFLVKKWDASLQPHRLPNRKNKP